MHYYTFRKIASYLFNKVKKATCVFYEISFPSFAINEDAITESIEEFHLEGVTVKIKTVMDGFVFDDADNVEYSDKMLNWVGAGKHLKNNSLFLNPPNVAVIDFLLKNIKKDAVILDYGSGLGHLLVYLRGMGFRNIFGYDNFSQFKEVTIKKFLEHFNLAGIVLPKREAMLLKPNVMVCISYFWSRLDQDLINKEINNPELEYILLDHYYASYHIKNFKIIGIYKNLLIVFKRIS